MIRRQPKPGPKSATAAEFCTIAVRSRSAGTAARRRCPRRKIELAGLADRDVVHAVRRRGRRGSASRESRCGRSGRAGKHVPERTAVAGERPDATVVAGRARGDDHVVLAVAVHVADHRRAEDRAVEQDRPTAQPASRCRGGTRSTSSSHRVARRTGTRTDHERHAAVAAELPDRRARLEDLMLAVRPQAPGSGRCDTDRAQDAGPTPVAARTAGARVAADEDVHATEVRFVVERGRVPDRVEACPSGSPGSACPNAVDRVDAVVEAAEHDIGVTVAVDVTDGRGADDAVLARRRSAYGSASAREPFALNATTPPCWPGMSIDPAPTMISLRPLWSRSATVGLDSDATVWPGMI